MLCPDCYSSEFRLSRLRLHDIPQLMALHYPIRCKRCKTRTHTTFPQAMKLFRQKAPSDQHPEASSK